ncbi:O-antigen ligase family protein [bacterium]|nr:O-antigen ligase family protein [bacterium]
MSLTRSTAALRLQRFSFWALSVFAVFAVASIALQNFIFLALVAWIIGMGLKRRWQVVPTPMNLPLLLLGIALVAASIWAGRMNPSLFGLRKVGLFAVFFLTTALVTHPLKADRILNVFILGATVCAIGSIAGHLLGWDGGRAHSFSGDYMAAGGMYMLSFILSLSRFLYQDKTKQWFWLGCAGMIGLALLLTYTRSSWIGAAVALLILGAFRDWRLPLIILGGVIVFLLVFPKNPVSQRVFSLTVKHHSSNSERRMMWVSGLKLVKNQPLRGYGVDNLSQVYGKVANPVAIEQRPPHVHNTLLQIAINGGLVAAGFFLWWIVVVIFFGIQGWKFNRVHAPPRAGSAIGITAAFVGFTVNGLFEFNFGTSQVITIVYFLIGLLPAYLAVDPANSEWQLPKRPKLLFLRPRFRGDVMMASTVPYLIKRDFPHAQVDLVTEPACVGAAGGTAGWDHVISLPRHDNLAWWKVVRRLRAENYDAACDLFGNPRSAMLVYASGANLKIGPRVTGWDLFFHLITKANRTGPRPAWEAYFDILRSFGMKQLSVRPHWEISAEDDKWIKSFLKERGVRPGKVLGIFPGGSHPAKRWPLENFLEVARLAPKQLGLKAMFVFGPLEKDLKRGYMHAAGKMLMSIEGLPPGRLAALWSHCAVVLSNDAFPMHLGPAVGTPTVGLFGPGDPQVWFPYSERSGHRALHHQLDCWPCHLDSCATMKCWEELTPATVMGVIKNSLPRNRSAKMALPEKTSRKKKAVIKKKSKKKIL